MFTGIVEELGTVQAIQRGARSAVLTICAPGIANGIKVGDSVATNGVCLTATSIKGTTFTADCMPETMDRSSLGQLRAGSRVNLERAMPADGRFGGHIVSGHIDGTGTIASVSPDDNAVWYRIAAPQEIMRYVIVKGSICIDGISLTVAKVDDQGFSVSVIPHTRQVTNLSSKGVGDLVNLEADIIGKYVEKFITQQQPVQEAQGLTMDFLVENGF